MKAKDSNRTERLGVAIAMDAFESLDFAFREQSESDYGIDAHAELIRSEQPTGQLLGIQLKSGLSYLSESDTHGSGYIFRTDKEHFDYWINHALPVLICLCDIDSKIIYWQIVNSETAVSTGKGYKITIPKHQKVDAASIDLLKSILTPIVATTRYTIFKVNDSSLGTAKRYSIEVVLNGSANKAEIAGIIRQVTNKGRKYRYHRNYSVERHWKSSDTHVIWTMVYASAEDHKRGNHICQSAWFSESLNPQFRPVQIDGENIGDSIIVDWNTNYGFFSKYIAENTVEKEDYLAKILPLIEQLKSLLDITEGKLADVMNGEISEESFLAFTDLTRKQIDKLYFEISDLPFAPFECCEAGNKLKNFASHIHNIWIFYSDKGLAKWDDESRLSQALQQRSYTHDALRQLEHELLEVK